jgi:hypothetical protein
MSFPSRASGDFLGNAAAYEPAGIERIHHRCLRDDQRAPSGRANRDLLQYREIA